MAHPLESGTIFCLFSTPSFFSHQSLFFLRLDWGTGSWDNSRDQSLAHTVFTLRSGAALELLLGVYVFHSTRYLLESKSNQDDFTILSIYHFLRSYVAWKSCSEFFVFSNTEKLYCFVFAYLDLNKKISF